MAAYDYAYMALYHHKSFHAFTSHRSTIQEMGTRIAWCSLFWVYTCSLSLGSLKHTVSHLPMEKGAASTIYNGRFIEAATWIFHAPLYIYQWRLFRIKHFKAWSETEKPALHREITHNLETDAYLMTMQRIVTGGRDQPKFDRQTE